jgi:hypothetical protein
MINWILHTHTHICYTTHGNNNISYWIEFYKHFFFTQLHDGWIHATKRHDTTWHDMTHACMHDTIFIVTHHIHRISLKHKIIVVHSFNPTL